MEALYPTTTTGWAALSVAAVFLFLILWNRREGRRKHAMKAAGQLRAWGCDDVADLLEAYAIGNYLGTGSIFRTVKKLVERVQTEGIPAMFSKMANKILEHRLTTEEGRKEVAEKLAIAMKIAEAKEKIAEPTPDLPIDIA